MSDNKTAMKEHENKVSVVATLSEINLEKKSIKKKFKTKEGEITKDVFAISGTIVGKLSETNSITIRAYATALTNSGSANKAYDHLDTIMRDWPTIAKNGTDSAIRFSCNADFSPTHYMGNDGKMHEGVPQYRANFFSQVKDEFNEDGSLKNPNKAEIKCDLYVISVKPESGKDGETGRWIVDGWVSLFSGVEKTSFIVPVAYADGINEYITHGDTIEIYADVINSEKRETIVKKMGIGADHTEVKVTYKNELVLTGANKLNDSENPAEIERVFTEEQMTNAINEYKLQVESLKNGGGTEKSVNKAPASDNKALW